MPIFGKRSLSQRESCHPDLILILDNAIKRIDFTIIRGHRGKLLQNEFHKRGTSKKVYPDSYHNTHPSLAADCIPYPFKSEYWESEEGLEKFRQMALVILEEAKKLGVELLWGFKAWGWDHPHFQLMARNGVPYPKIYKREDD